MSLIELLIDELDADLSKRKREIADLRTLALGASSARFGMVARACHVMAYAHWEGFSKAAFTNYLTFLTRLQLTLGKLREPLQALALMKSMHQAVGSTPGIASVLLIMQKCDARSTERFVIAGDEVLKGNMTSEKLRTLLEATALDYLPYYATREKFIDEILCGRRHRIAHGDWQPILQSDMDEVVRGTLELCDTLNHQIQEVALYQKYRP